MSLAEVNVYTPCMMSWIEQLHDCSSFDIIYTMFLLHAIALNDNVQQIGSN